MRNLTEMKSERYNIFEKTHKKLAGLVFEAGAALQKPDDRKPEEISKTLNQITLATRYFEYHIRREDSIIYNALASFAPFIISEMEKNNKIDLRLAGDIEKKIEILYSLTNLGGESNKKELQTTFFAFASAVLLHINKEETVVNELLCKIYSDEQLKELEWTVNINLQAEEITGYSSCLSWLLNDGEPVFESYKELKSETITEEELFHSSFSSVEAA